MRISNLNSICNFIIEIHFKCFWNVNNKENLLYYIDQMLLYLLNDLKVKYDFYNNFLINIRFIYVKL